MKNTHASVMVLVHDTSSRCALQNQVIERTRFCDGQTDRQTHRHTDRQTDRQAQGEKQYVSRPLQGGDIMRIRMGLISYHLGDSSIPGDGRNESKYDRDEA